MPLFATTGDVPERVKTIVGYAGNSAELADQIDVVVHPQSIVHSMVEFVDGAVVVAAVEAVPGAAVVAAPPGLLPPHAAPKAASPTSDAMLTRRRIEVLLWFLMYSPWLVESIARCSRN